LYVQSATRSGGVTQAIFRNPSFMVFVSLSAIVLLLYPNVGKIASGRLPLFFRTKSSMTKVCHAAFSQMVMNSLLA
ncbi:hypothetical protein, partial [Ruminococcus sp.]|uniref:hypothetical protein n=1 Tax=Ruminococcus sp. TaxID=41978 RepID=UPI003FD7F6A6